MKSVQPGRRLPTPSFVLMLVIGAPAMAQPFTVATFADPSPGGDVPLFSVDLAGGLILGGWSDALTDLVLEVPAAGLTFTDAFLTLNDPFGGDSITIVGRGGATTGPGVVSFFADGDDPGSVEPLVRIEFGSASLTPGALAADELLSLDVIQIDGRALGDTSGWSQRAFGFALANHVLLDPSDPSAGFTATASFTSSAVPEPSAMVLLLAGCGIMAIRRRARSAVARSG